MKHIHMWRTAGTYIQKRHTYTQRDIHIEQYTHGATYIQSDLQIK